MTQEVTETRAADGGPPAGVVASISFVLMVAGLVLGGVMSGGATLSSPLTETSQYVAGIRDHRDAMRVVAFFQFGSAIPLAIYAATMYARQLRLGVRVPGPVIGLVGGVLAVVSLQVSAFATFAESRPEVTTDATVVHALALLAFVAGGPGYVVGLGLLIAGIAVPAFLLRLLPRRLAAVGLVLAVVAELTWFALLFESATYLLPVSRFLGGLWLIAVGFALPGRRREGRTS